MCIKKYSLYTLCYYIFNKPFISENNDKPTRLGLLRLTDYLVELKRYNALTALCPPCIDVKEQRDQGEVGSFPLESHQAFQSDHARETMATEEAECAYMCELSHQGCTKCTASYCHKSLHNQAVNMVFCSAAMASQLIDLSFDTETNQPQFK